MIQRLCISPFSPLLATAVALAALSGCATVPAGSAMSVGQEATIEGNVVSVNTDPWAYDGNAVVMVSTAKGDVRVQLPARWNLCKAQPLDDIQSFEPNDRVQAVGTVTGPGEMVVCGQPEHRLTEM
ncbi:MULTISPECIES: hypothetical protein [unclassified Pseudoxanthomonas]|uniref:hypothetical protein n=1 Tax=unclassified Pseudoxanthomonas TaxID=2645906 RepID=UPI003076CE3D